MASQAIQNLTSVTVTEAVDEVFKILMPIGHSAMFLGAPGAGKSMQVADAAREFVSRFGGVFIGWEKGDYLIVTDPPEELPEYLTAPVTAYYVERGLKPPQIGGKWAWTGDRAAPKVVPNEDGVYAIPALCYRHTVMTGVTSLDLQGSNMPIDTFVTQEMMDKYQIQPEPISVFAKPFLFQGMPDVSAYCILTLDEFAKTRENFPKYASLAHGGRVGDHELPGRKNTVVFIGNRSTDKAGSFDPTTDMTDRVRIYHVVPDRRGHIAWMRARGYPAYAMAFCNESVGADTVYASPIPKDGTSYCSSRSFSDLIEELMQRERVYNEPVDPRERMVKIAAIMKIGSSAGTRFLEMLELGPQLPTIKAVITDPKGCALPSSPIAKIYMMEVLARAATMTNFEYICQYVFRFNGAPRGLFINSILERHDRNTRAIEKGQAEPDPDAARLMTSPLPIWEAIYDAAQKMRELNR
jgi:hypothetical protein